MDFNDKVVLITGASSGIGASCALNFAKLCAKLALVGRNVEKLKQVSDQCEDAKGIKPLNIIADISKEDDISHIIKETINTYGKIDVLVNNAGILLMGKIYDDISIYDRISATNVRGTYMLTQQAIPHLIKTKGNIIIISSLLSTVSYPAFTNYCMTKAALDMFTKCVAQELAPMGVRVNSVNPGPVNTNLFKTAGISDEQFESLYETMRESLPLKKIARPEDIVGMVIFLASDRANCITGSFHTIDCGLHLGQSIMI